METKEILILTKSAKHHEYCVAGIDLQRGTWVRLVSDNRATMYALSRNMIRCNNNYECQILDVVRVNIIKRVPLEIQKENILIDETVPFEFVRRAKVDEILPYLDSDINIYGGTSCFVNRYQALKFGYSLRMFRVYNPVLSEHTNSDGYVRKKISFTYNGVSYLNWSMTDSKYFNAKLGRIADEAIIVVSIPEDDYRGNFYKFVAQIFV